MEQKLWTLALLSALLLTNPQLHSFQVWVKGNGTLENKVCNSMQIKIGRKEGGRGGREKGKKEEKKEEGRKEKKRKSLNPSGDGA